MKQPPIGLTVPVRFLRALDGDTIEVVFEERLIVRITDDAGNYNSPEIHKPASDAEIKLGLAAKKELEEIIKSGKQIVVYCAGTI